MLKLRFKRTLCSSAVLVSGIVAVAAFAPSAYAQAPTVNHGYTELVVNPATAATLSSLNITVAPVSPAWVNGDGIAFPITDGLFGILSTLTITHSGGLALSDNGTTVDLTDFDIVLPQRELTAIVNGGPRVAILNLKFAAAKIGFMTGVLSIGPVEGDLTQAAASALNAAFGLGSTIPAGLDLGEATVDFQL